MWRRERKSGALEALRRGRRAKLAQSRSAWRRWVRTFYRVLAAQGLVHERRTQLTHPHTPSPSWWPGPSTRSGLGHHAAALCAQVAALLPRIRSA